MRLTIPVALGALIAATSPAQRFEAGPAWKAAPADGAFHRFVAPGASFDLAVSVTDTGGAPITSGSVTFVLPESGFGTFTGEGERSWLRTVALSDGTAKVTVSAPGQDSYFTVSALADGTTQEVTFAITVAAEAPTPGWAPGAARATAAEAFGVSPDDPGLHGPYWLPAGGQFGPARDFGTPQPVASASFFFWHDPAPLSDFFHPVRYLPLPGDAVPEAPAVPVEASWWPELRSANGSSRSRLIRALADGSIRTHPADYPAPTEFRASRPAPVTKSPSFAEPAPDGACSIIAHGVGRQFAINKETMTGVFTNTLRIPADRQLSTGGSTQAGQLREMLDKLVDLDCTKVYLYMSGHGGSAGIEWADPSNPANGIQDSYGAIASYLEGVSGKLRARGITLKVCIVIQACGSGGAVPVFQGHGFDGEILTSSDRDHYSYSYPLHYGSFFTAGLADCWNSSGSDLNGDGTTSFDELLQGTVFPGPSFTGLLLPPLEVWRQSYIRDSFPQFSRIHGEGLAVQPPAVTVLQGSTVAVTLPRPDWAVGDLSVRVEVAAPGIATVNGQDFINLTVPADSNQIRFNILGRSAGQTAYTVQIQRDAQGKSGSGRSAITVTAPVSLAPATGGGNALGLLSNTRGAATITRTGNLALPATFRLNVTEETPGIGPVAFVPFDVTIPANSASAAFNVFTLRPGKFTVSATSGATTVSLPGLSRGVAFLDGSPTINVGPTTAFPICLWDQILEREWKAYAADARAIINLALASEARRDAVRDCFRLGDLSITGREAGGSLIQLRGATAAFTEAASIYAQLNSGPPAGLFLSGLPTTHEAGSAYGLDLAVGTAGGFYIPDSTFDFSLQNVDLYQQGRPLNPNGTSTASIRVGPNGFASIEYVPRAPGASSIQIRAGSGPTAPLNFNTIARSAELADDIRLLNIPEEIAVNTTGGFDLEVRRLGQPLANTVVTCEITGGGAEFTAGQLARRNTLTQFTFGATGRGRVPIRLTAPRPAFLKCRSGRVGAELLIRPPFPPR